VPTFQLRLWHRTPDKMFVLSEHEVAAITGSVPTILLQIDTMRFFTRCSAFDVERQEISVLGNAFNQLLCRDGWHITDAL